MSDFEFNDVKNETPAPKKAKMSRGAEQKPESKAEIDLPEQTEEKKPEFDPEELSQIFDQIMFEGYYDGKATIRGKSVTFRTRTADETIKISHELDTLKVNFVTTLQQHRAMLNLAYSLVNFNGKDLSGMAAQPDRYKYISNLPTQVIARLEEELAKFDLKVDAACRDPENF